MSIPFQQYAAVGGHGTRREPTPEKNYGLACDIATDGHHVSAGAVTAVIMMILLLVACSGGGSGQGLPRTATVPAASPAQASTIATDVAPVTANGQPEAGYAITEGGSAQGCEAGSDVAPQAYRCFAGNSVYDPCWLDNADATQTSVLCQPNPGYARAVRLTVAAGGLPAFLGAPQSIDRQYPWGVRLADGETCTAVEGSHDNYHGKIIDYSCGSSYQHVLLRPIDQLSPLWTFQSAYYDGTSYQPGPLENVTRAWYAMPDNGAAADARAGNCTATALAYAAQAYEAAHNDPEGPLPAINVQACDDEYAETIFTTSGNPGYTAAMAFKASSSGWREIGSSDYITPGSFGMPVSVGQAINNSMASTRRKESVAF